MNSFRMQDERIKATLNRKAKFAELNERPKK